MPSFLPISFANRTSRYSVGGSCLFAAALMFTVHTAAGAQAAPDTASTQTPTALAGHIVGAFNTLFSGPHTGARAVHAKGVLVEGRFVPTEKAALLSRAMHFQNGEFPVLVRFSNFAGVPSVADGDAAGSPRGMSIKFMLPDGGDTDIVAHSYNGFPVSTPEDFLEFLQALAAPDAAILNDFLANHPAAQAFAAAPKPTPQSFAREFYFGVNAFRFTNEAGISHYGRYRIEPVEGGAYFNAGEADAYGPDHLSNELAQRLARKTAQFNLMVQLARTGDPITDGSVAWPAHRETINLGTLTLTALATDNQARQRTLLFTPLNLVGGIAPSADPLLVSRNRAYRLSFLHRARPTEPAQEE